ncbi:MAG: LamB/YcsF family protein, partial [Dokdonella sp.]
VKPHGALYNMAARDAGIAVAIATAVRDFDIELVLVGLAMSELPRAGRRAGLEVAHEAFVDRRYENDGSLTPRSREGALITDIDAAIEQALDIVVRGRITSRTGSTIEVRADTLCVHGDRAQAAELARRLRTALDAAGISVKALREKRPASAQA